MGNGVIKWGAIVIVIWLLAVILFPQRGCVIPASFNITKSNVSGLAIAVQAYKQEYGRWPEVAFMYRKLLGENERGIVFWEPTRKHQRPDGSMNDFWGHPIIFDGIVDNKPRFHSIGKDGIDQHGAEGSDDIVSWR
jgi:hypothetical protein